MNRFVWLLLALFMLSFVGASSPPTISEQPQSATIPVGQPAIFAVTAAGEGLSYQWTKNGQDIPGATQAAFIIAAVTMADAGAFQVRVTNDKGSVTSCTAKLTVIESGNPSTGPPECPGASGDEGGGGCGGGGGGGGGNGSSSSASSSGGSSGAPSNELPPEFQPYPVTRWKGSVKATSRFDLAEIKYTQTVEGEVTFESGREDIGLHPTTITLVEGTFTMKREGTSGNCSDTVNASATMSPGGGGALTFQPDPPPPQRATELKYSGVGYSIFEGQQTRVCEGGTTTNAYLATEYWMMTGDQRTSPDLLVISGTYVQTWMAGHTTTFEWHLVKQR